VRNVHDPVDVVGVGFGPSNLALAIALKELNDGLANRRPITSRFFELQASFGWHRGMLVEGATMQISFLKDLVTMRNPVSNYSFISYLHAKNRLVDFINAQTFHPFRIEFNDYFEWVADQFSDLVEYGSDVVEIRPVIEGGDVECLDIFVRRANGDGVSMVQRARNVVIASGLEPNMPPGIPQSDRIWHTAHLIDETDRIAQRSPSTFVVVGAGQSAAEAVDYLHRMFSAAEIYSVHSRYGYSVADESAFANQVFNPAAVDDFYAAPKEVKQMLMEYHGNTNYSVVDLGLIQDLYKRMYLEGVTGRRRLKILNVSRLLGASADANGVRVDIEFLPTGEKTAIDADALVCATGYRASDPIPLLPMLIPHFKLDDGALRLHRDHRIMADEHVKCGIYLQGYENTHGISETLLSLSAIRAGEIAASLAAGHFGRAEPMTDDKGTLSEEI
jgi:L-ornithine N5-monooxygenase